MKTQAFNPYLPSYEYVPDGEPYVFGDRIYIYGSHDQFNGIVYCANDYVCWSAPVNNPANWRYEGVIYKKTQDPMNRNGKHQLYAPDVAQGVDGKYYLYYAFDFLSVMAVAVCDTPAGQYEFYGYVSRPNGSILWDNDGDPFLFDPGVLVDDDGKVFLYSGFAPEKPMNSFIAPKKRTYEGGYVIELEQDMKTVKGEPRLIFPKVGKSAGTGFEGHEFFEASSIRKIRDTYYFVYSSINGHELCYATSKSPTGGFIYGGTIVSNGDLYLNGHTEDQDAYYYVGNNHGSIVEINGQWYVFYHRQTNRHQYSRQAMAEAITIMEDGSIAQVEMTSYGLNNGPLIGKGKYPSYIACHLTSAKGTGRYGFGPQNIAFWKHPYLTQDGKDREEHPGQYIANMRTGATAGYKYFVFNNLNRIAVSIRGRAKGMIEISTAFGGKPVGYIPINSGIKEKTFRSNVIIPDGKQALYFTFKGKGKFDFLSFTLN